MGFGTLFIGYFIAFLMSFHKFGFACQIVGFYVIFCALQKLVEYKKCLTKAIFPLLIMTLCSIYDAGAMISETFLALPFPQAVNYIADILFISASFFFHMFLLRGIISLGEDTELPKISAKARWDLVFVTFYLLLNVVLTILSFIALKIDILAEVTRIMAPIAALISIMLPICILFTVHSCYMNICAPEDVDMQPKPSRFAFINKSRKMSEEKDKLMEEWLQKQKDQKKSKKK